MLHAILTTNIWEIPPDSLLLPLLIDVTELYAQQSSWTMVEHLKDQQEQGKPKLSKI